MKNLAITFIAVLAIISAPIGALAADYSITFDDYPVSIVNYDSPLATYSVVTSKWNQPRSIGTNPHNGVDLRASIGTTVYAPYNGWITHISGVGGTDIAFIVDVNKNVVMDDGDYKIRFYHLNSRQPEGYKVKGLQIGSSGDKGTSQPHLHFGNCASSGGVRWFRTEPNYRHLSSSYWNSGKDLDSYSAVTWSNNTAYFTAYEMTVGDKDYFEVNLFYRTVTGGTWIDGGVLTRSGDDYRYDFTGKFPVGTNVQWMFRLKLSDVSQNAFGKAKFFKPDNNPNATTNAYAYWSNTIT